MTDPAMINFLEAARSLSLDRRHKLMRQLMNYVLAEWPESPDAHVHMGNFLEWQALDEDNYRVMRKADVSYLKAIELAPDRIDVLYDYITFLTYFGNIDDAEKYLIFIKDRPSKKMVKEISLDIQEVKTRVDPAAGIGHAWGVATSSNPHDPMIWYDTRANSMSVGSPCPSCVGWFGDSTLYP